MCTKTSKNPAKPYWGKFHLKEEVAGVQLFGIIWGKSCNFEMNKKGEGNMKRGVAVGGTFIGYDAVTD